MIRKKYYYPERRTQEELNIKLEKYRKSHPWQVSFRALKQRCLNKNHDKYKYYGLKGVKVFINLKEIKELWFRDKAYLMKKPSIDRINTSGNYEFSNCRFVEHSFNCSRPKTKWHP